MKEIKYILTETELHELLQDQKRLEALEAYGVDNWDGYEEAINDEEFEVTDDDLANYSTFEPISTESRCPFD